MKIINNWSGTTYHAVKVSCTPNEIIVLVKWCTDTVGPRPQNWRCDYNHYFDAIFYFPDEANRTWFLLRWS